MRSCLLESDQRLLDDTFWASRQRHGGEGLEVERELWMGEGGIDGLGSLEEVERRLLIAVWRRTRHGVYSWSILSRFGFDFLFRLTVILCLMSSKNHISSPG